MEISLQNDSGLGLKLVDPVYDRGVLLCYGGRRVSQFIDAQHEVNPLIAVLGEKFFQCFFASILYGKIG